MNAPNHVLLASHNTEGARAAERMVWQLCTEDSTVHHLVVVPSLWKGMTGDDWLNNGSTRDRFRSYLENELESEVREHISRMETEAEQQSINYSVEVMVGEPGECLASASQSQPYDLIVMGSPRPKGKQGIRSRMRTERLTHSLQAPLLIVPYPHE